MQDENLKGWHKGLFGRTVQHSVLGQVKARLVKHERVTVLPSREATTKYCPCCGKLKEDKRYQTGSMSVNAGIKKTEIYMQHGI